MSVADWGRTRSHVLLLVAVALVAANLRMAVTSVGSVLDLVIAGTGLTPAAGGVLTALPVLSFALLGGLSPWLARRLGVERAIAAATALLAVALVLRVLGGPLWLMAGTFLACTGIAAANVLVPVVVKQRFPMRVGFVTGVYTAALAGGSALAAGLTAPLADAAGSWRVGLGFWAVPAATALVLWWAATRSTSARGRRARGPARVPHPTGRLWRSPRTWALTAFFGTQSLLAYSVMGWLPAMFRDAGLSAAASGTLLAVSILLGVPVSFLVPSLAARRRQQSGWAVALTAASAAGLLGMLLAPAEGAWLWVVLLGIGNGAFPLALAFFSLRSGSTDDTAWLSAVGQSIGYTLAIVGPLGVGVLRAGTDGWTAPVLLLLTAMVVQAVAGAVAGRAGHV